MLILPYCLKKYETADDVRIYFLRLTPAGIAAVPVSLPVSSAVVDDLTTRSTESSSVISV